MEQRTGIAQSIWINRIRSRIMTELMLYNTRMVRMSGNLVPDDVDRI